MKFVGEMVILILLATMLSSCQCYDLTIMHTNDVHARFEQFNSIGSECSEEDAADGVCYGGVARRATKIKEIRDSYENTLLLDSGDQFEGTQWFYFYEGAATSYFMNQLGYDAMTLGNHEFDLGVEGLIRFLKNVTFPVVSSNIDAAREPEIAALLQRSVVLNVGGEMIGIVGYTLTRTPELSTPGPNLIFEDEIQSVQVAVDELTEAGVNKIIALGHFGYGNDIEVAKNTVGIDIIVGGYTETFLYTGTPPTDEEVAGPYPTVIVPEKSQEDRVLIVQDFTYAKYLGFLQVTFDDEGKITSYDGNPILLDASVEQDPDKIAEVINFAEPISQFENTVFGQSYVKLVGDRMTCRTRECNLGNLVTDAMLESVIRYEGGESWSDVSISLIVGGGIRTTVDQGAITFGNVVSVLPFQDTFDAFDLEGRYLLEALENSVTFYNDSRFWGRFLQVSGLIVTYNVNRPVGQRVVSVEVRCTECSVPDYVPLDLDKTYRIVSTPFLTSGGDGYTVIADNLKNYQTGKLDVSVLGDYIRKYSPIIQGIERRILFDDSEYVDEELETKKPSNDDVTDDPGEENNFTDEPPKKKIKPGMFFGR